MTPVVRPATPDDAGAIVALIRRLAAFEGAASAAALTEDTVRRDGFGPGRRFEVLLGENESGICGCVVLLQSYSSWAGAPTLIIHDLYVDEAARGRGLGRALLASAAGLALARGGCRLDVNVLTWNRAAGRFYEGLGFTPLPDWQPHRLDAEGLRRLAAPLPPERKPAVDQDWLRGIRSSRYFRAKNRTFPSRGARLRHRDEAVVSGT